MEGWIKLHRVLLEKPIWLKSTSEQKAVLMTLLLMANHKKSKWEWQGNLFEVKPGQFITSLESIKQAAGKGISIQNVRSSLNRFKKLNFLTDESTKTGRLITICNWSTYQYDETFSQQRNQQRDNKEVTSNKNEKNEKNYSEKVNSMNLHLSDNILKNDSLVKNSPIFDAMRTSFENEFKDLYGDRFYWTDGDKKALAGILKALRYIVSGGKGTKPDDNIVLNRWNLILDKLEDRYRYPYMNLSDIYRNISVINSKAQMAVKN